MSATSLEGHPSSPPTDGIPPRGWRWWLRVAEVRLRFVAVVAVTFAVVGGWDRLREVWDRLRHAAGGTAATAVSGDTEYFCPMDPGVLSAWPAICPICNMDLVQRRKHDAQILPEGVVARMQISPYRVQLAGIRTSEVAAEPLSQEIAAAGRLEQAGDGSQGLWFEAAVSPADVPSLREQREAALRTAGGAVAASGVATLLDDGDVPRVRVALTGDPSGFVAGASVRAVIRIPVASEAGGLIAAVPESAVVDHGDRQLVFVESMPGQFDAVPVTLGRRCGDRYPVLAGLTPGQRVATAGAYLIDAETRLNPSLAVAYFGAAGGGASEAGATSRAPEVRVAKTKGTKAKLSPEDLALANRQKVCPVTDLPLDSMGGPVPVVVEGRKAFLCCAGCEGKLKSNAAKYLAKLPADD